VSLPAVLFVSLIRPPSTIIDRAGMHSVSSDNFHMLFDIVGPPWERVTRRKFDACLVSPRLGRRGVLAANAMEVRFAWNAYVVCRLRW
jgi:hypothetical protein